MKADQTHSVSFSPHFCKGPITLLSHRNIPFSFRKSVIREDKTVMLLTLQALQDASLMKVDVELLFPMLMTPSYIRSPGIYDNQIVH